MLKTIQPRLSELSYRKRIMQDIETMSYNAHYNLDFPEYNNDTGCILFDESSWKSWYSKWINNEPTRFYAYLQNEDGNYVGEINYHLDPASNTHTIGILIEAKYRGLGYGLQGLKLLIEKAKQDGLKILRNDFEIERTAALKAHLDVGFKLTEYKNDYGCPIIELILDVI